MQPYGLHLGDRFEVTVIVEDVEIRASGRRRHEQVSQRRAAMLADLDEVSLGLRTGSSTPRRKGGAR
jgi:hypothetical protein